jgi:hypothetical protein
MTGKDNEGPDGQSGPQPDDPFDIPGQDSSSQPGSMPPDPFVHDPFGYAPDFSGDSPPGELTPEADDYRRRAYEMVAHLTGDYAIPCFPVWHMVTDSACACKDGINCESKGKHPRDFAWPQVATADPEQAARWWRPLGPGEEQVDWRPEANIGIMMGEKHFLLDVDMGEDQQGDASLAALISHYGQDMPVTLLYQTGGGGRQAVMLIPEGVEVRNSVSELGDNLDIRGQHGYGIVPPSRSGKGPYSMVADVAPAAPPAWLADWLTEQHRKRTERLQALPKGGKNRPLPGKLSQRARGYIDAALADAIKKVSEAPNHGRNNELNAQAWALFTRFGIIGLLDPGDIAAALKDAAGACGLRGAEIPRTLRSAWEGAESKDRSGELPAFVFDEPVKPPNRIPSITSCVYASERIYSLRRSATGEFISRPNVRELPALVSDIGTELGHKLRLWWRAQAEAWEQHIRDIAAEAAAQAGADDKAKDDDAEHAVIFAPDATFSNVLSHLQASATQHDPVIQHTRCFDDRENARIVVDLCNDLGEVIEITPDAIAVRDPRDLKGQPWFRRGGDMGTLVYPEKPDSVILTLEQARLILDVTPEQWKVVLAGLIGAFFPSIDRPGWWLTGPSGAGKTTRGRMIAGWVDPSKYLGGRLNIKRDERNARTRAMHRYIVSLDNYTSVSQEESDFWCTLHTGVSDAVRKLHSDNTMLAYEYKRLGLATSLVLPDGLQGDALRRTLHIDLPVSDKHPDSSLLWKKYDNIKPAVVGALCMVLSGVLRELDDAEQEELEDCPEMADFARRLRAADRAYPSLGLYDAYCGHAVEIMRVKASNDPFVLALNRWLEKQEGEEFTGLTSDLYTRLGNFLGFETANKWWPADATRLSGKLTKLREPLAAVGVIVEKGNHTREGTIISVKRQAVVVAQDVPDGV